MNLRVVHLLTRPMDERERRSYQDISQLMKFGAEYIQVVNAPYIGEIPAARECNDRIFRLGEGHYGCWKAHRDAILKYLTPDIDALLIFECDAVFCDTAEVFWERVQRAYSAMIEGNLHVFTFGYRHDGKTIDRVGEGVIVITQFIETHAYLLLPKSRQICEETFQRPWDTIDYAYTVYWYDQLGLRIGTFADRPMSVQATGISLIDNKVKSSEDHYRNVRYQE